mgnify:FL=1
MADGKVIIDVELNEGKAVRGVDNVNRRLSAIVSSGRRAATSIRNMVTALGLTAAAAKAINMVSNALDGAISRYDTLKGFPAVMEQIGFSSDEAQKAIQRLSDGVQGLPTTLDSVAKTAQRIAVMTGDLDGAVETTLALNNAFIASGASVADAERGLEQYIQMLATGAVDLQSWRTLQETMGVALNDVAKAFGFAGKSAQNDLYEALKSGEITFEEFNAKLIELSNQTGGFADRARTAAGGIRTAWTNMRTAVVRGVTNILEAIDEVLADTPLQSIENVIKNIGDAFFNALDGVAQFIKGLKDSMGEVNSFGDFVRGLFQTVAENIPSILQSILNKIVEYHPKLVEMGLTNGQKIMEGLLQSIPQILEAVQQFIQNFVQVFIDNMPSMSETGAQFMTALVDGIVLMLPQLIEMGGQLISSLIETIVALLPHLIETGIQVLIKLVEGIINALPSLIQAAVQIIDTAVQVILENLPKIIQAGIDLLFALVDGIINNLPALIQAAIELIVRLVATLIKNLPKIIQAGIEILLALIDGLIKTIPTLVGSIPKIVDAIFKAFGKVNWKEIGKDIINGLIKGLTSLASSVWQKAQEIADGVKRRIKEALKIGSPSKIMIEMGEFTGEGLAIGLDRTVRDVMRKAQSLAQAAVPEIQPLSIQPTMGAVVATGTGGGSIGDIYIRDNVFHIREEADVEKVSRQLFKMALEQSRGPRGRL